MTPAEAHVWIAVFAADFQANKTSGLRFEFDAARLADAAVERLRKRIPEKLAELDAALRQGSDIL